MDLSCFKAYDIRGRVPDQLNVDLAEKIGVAYATVLKTKKVVVGYDIRESSPELVEALIRGLRAAGTDVYNIGMCGTEQIYFSTFHYKMDGGIMVTASHNPKDYNGLKLVMKDARPVHGETGLNEIKEMIASGSCPPVTKLAGSEQPLEAMSDYIQHLLGYIDLKGIKPLRIVVNAGHGGAGMIIDEIERHLPFEFIKIHHGRLFDLNMDLNRSHQGKLAGIPKHFDWAIKPRLDVFKDISRYKTAIGWGHALWNENLPYNPELTLQIRNIQFYVCFGPDREWKQLQYGNITGAQFDTAFKNNVSRKASLQETVAGITSVKFDYGQVFHFWPDMGRSQLPAEDVHGFLTLFEARIVGASINSNPDGESYIIIGGGADLWLEMTTKWDNFKSHTDVGVGRMKFVGSNWTSYGFSSVSTKDLYNLVEQGYIEPTR